MACKSCAARRKALAVKKQQKQAQGKTVQAAVLSAVLAVSDAAGKVTAMRGEVESENNREHGTEAAGLEADVRGSQGAEPDR